MIGIERLDSESLPPPPLADAYGPAVTFACEGSKRPEAFCPRPIVWGHLVPSLGPGIWGFMCRKHGGVCRRMHPENLVAVTMAA